MIQMIRQLLSTGYTTPHIYDPRYYSYDILPPEKVRIAAAMNPWVHETLVAFSVEEYGRNPYYMKVIEGLVDHTIGPHTTIIGASEKIRDEENDFVEDSYVQWCGANSIGKQYRQVRREAAKTGIGIGIPFLKETSRNDVKTAYKVYGADCLENPYDMQPEDRIINGIGYDKNWEIDRFYLRHQDEKMGVPKFNALPKEYTVEEVIYWTREYKQGLEVPIPECFAAFTFYPYIRRYLQAVIEGEEFNASFPAAVTLDPAIYSDYAREQKNKSPHGKFEYEPKMIPTLAPGMDLTGIPHNVSAKDRDKIAQMFAGTCALSVQMPRNLALGDSSDNNMASAQVDIQPWGNKVKIDRFDMEPMFRKSFDDWWAIAVRRIMNSNIRRKHLPSFPHMYVYPDMFEHPDPNKRASARSLDLASGSTTLNRIYSNNGLNVRRELRREAKALGMEVEDLINVMMSTRSNTALDALGINLEMAKDE